MKTCWATYMLWVVIAIFGAGALLSGCGQKGDLYLPDDSNNQKKEKTERN